MSDDQGHGAPLDAGQRVERHRAQREDGQKRQDAEGTDAGIPHDTEHILSRAAAAKPIEEIREAVQVKPSPGTPT